MTEKLIILGHTGFIGQTLYHFFGQNPDWTVQGFSTQTLNLLDKTSTARLREVLDAKTTLIFCSAIVRRRQDDEAAMLKNIEMARNVAEALKEGSIKVYGDGSDRVDYVWVEDISPILDILIRKKSSGVFYVATGQNYTILELIKIVQEVIQKNVGVLHLKKKYPSCHYHLDNSPLEKESGFCSWTPLRQGVGLLHKELLKKDPHGFH